MIRFFAVFHAFLRHKMHDICAFDRANQYLEVLGWWHSSSNSSSIKCLSIAESRRYSKYYSQFWLFFAIAFWICPIDVQLGILISGKPATFAREKDSHRELHTLLFSNNGFFNVPRGHFKHGRYCETRPTVYSPYPRRLESLTIC